MLGTVTTKTQQPLAGDDRNGPTDDRKNGHKNGRSNGHGRISFRQLLEEFDYPQPQRGDIIQGEILRIDEDVLFVDVGSKRDAMVPYEEVSQLEEDFLDKLSRGDEVPVYVTRTPVGDEQLLVSLDRGLQILDWERAEKLEAADETIELTIINHNKGGLVAEFGRLQGFVPNSHVPEIRNMNNHVERQQYKAKQIGTTRPFKIIEISPQQERLVLSATAVQREQRQQRLQTLTVGEIVTGKVVNLKKYGAFADIGDGLTGLLHISKIAWEHIDHPADVLAVGDTLKLKIDDIEIERGRISLNRKVLLPGPWEQFTAANEAGDLVEGEVTAVVDFGAFVKIPQGVEGLLHQNEMNLPHGSSPADILQPGESVLVRIVSIEPDRQRLSLSMRRVSAAEEVLWMAENAAAKDEVTAETS
jgi:small subunit ribosomal protein S1